MTAHALICALAALILASCGGDDDAGSTATAVAVPSGGPYSGVDVDVKLVADPDLAGAWRLDSLLANVPAGP